MNLDIIFNIKNDKAKAFVANEQHLKYSIDISNAIQESSLDKNTGIAKRSVEYINKKILENKAVIAITQKGEWAGFCYIETFSNNKYVSNSGLIVSPKYRNKGLAKAIKKRILLLSLKQFPSANIFGLTTSLAVMKINSELGYEPVTYSELTKDDVFWNACETCVNYDVLKSKQRQNCLCTAMVFKKNNTLLKMRNNFLKINNN